MKNDGILKNLQNRLMQGKKIEVDELEKYLDQRKKEKREKEEEEAKADEYIISIAKKNTLKIFNYGFKFLFEEYEQTKYEKNNYLSHEYNIVYPFGREDYKSKRKYYVFSEEEVEEAYKYNVRHEYDEELILLGMYKYEKKKIYLVPFQLSELKKYVEQFGFIQDRNERSRFMIKSDDFTIFLERIIEEKRNKTKKRTK